MNNTGTMIVPNTGSWDVNQTITAAVNLSAGTQVMRVRFDTNASSGFTCGLADSIVFTPTGSS